MMLLHQSGFVTICPKKELDLHSADHRADHAAELKAEISWEAKGVTGSEFAFLPGGAVRALNPNSSMTLAQEGECIAVFKGNLNNKAELALGLVGCPPHVSEAQLLLHLYASAGLDMLRRLQGQFAICLYDSKQARVLAARDHSGSVPLLEGRTAAGSLIIACGTFLPEGVTQMVDIGPGEYKYGWHALPRPFQCGAGKIVAGRASCDYGIRRRSIDAYNAPARASVSRTVSLDANKPSSHNQHGHSTSHSLPHTPGRYMPPHLHAASPAAAGNAAGAGGSWGRQRASSCDGSHPAATPPTPSSSGTGRRRSENNSHGHGSHQQGHRHGHGSGGHGQQHWAPKSPMVVVVPPTPASPASPAATRAGKAAGVAAAASPSPGSQTSALTRELLASPSSAPAPSPAAASAAAEASDASTPKSGEQHRRKRRHHRRSRKNSGAAGDGAAAEDGNSSDAESQVSSSTLESAGSGALPAPAAAAASSAPAVAGKQAGNRRSSKDGGARALAAPAAANKPAASQQQHKAQPPQQQQRRASSSGGGSSGGFKRTGSCSELAVLGSSPTAAHAALLAGPQQGLAC